MDQSCKRITLPSTSFSSPPVSATLKMGGRSGCSSNDGSPLHPTRLDASTAYRPGVARRREGEAPGGGGGLRKRERLPSVSTLTGRPPLLGVFRVSQAGPPSERSWREEVVPTMLPGMSWRWAGDKRATRVKVPRQKCTREQRRRHTGRSAVGRAAEQDVSRRAKAGQARQRGHAGEGSWTAALHDGAACMFAACNAVCRYPTYSSHETAWGGGMQACSTRNGLIPTTPPCAAWPQGNSLLFSPAAFPPSRQGRVRPFLSSHFLPICTT